MHSPGFHQLQKQAQTQVVTPHLRQSLEILQVSALELRDVILEELQSNPVLEELPLDSFSLNETNSPPPPPSNELYFQENQNFNTYYSPEDAVRRQYFLDSVVTEKSLQEHIMEQAKLSECTPDELNAIEFMVGSLDDKGFLTLSIDEIKKLSNFSEETIISALKLLKNFDPTGIGSKDVQECLLIQLEAEGKLQSIAAHIIREHFSLLLRRRIPELAKKLNISIDEIQDALNVIATLDPTPGRRFQEDKNRPVIADASVQQSGNKWIVTLNNEYIPKIRLSSTYKELIAKGQLSLNEKEYIQDKMHSGKFILNAIEQRQKTIERITNAILKFQKDFFEKGIAFLHPLTMNKVGNDLGLHETTISRAIANKFLDTPHGLFPYKYFFTSGYNVQNNEGPSSAGIKEEILKIVQSEPPGKPYSDQKIVEILSERNITLSRRTVAKYREELGILATSLRRQY